VKFSLLEHLPERRVHRDFPPSYVTRLIDGDPPQRERLMAEAILNARPWAAFVLTLHCKPAPETR
jgi:hypothetical protein